MKRMNIKKKRFFPLLLVLVFFFSFFSNNVIAQQSFSNKLFVISDNKLIRQDNKDILIKDVIMVFHDYEFISVSYMQKDNNSNKIEYKHYRDNLLVLNLIDNGKLVIRDPSGDVIFSITTHEDNFDNFIEYNLGAKTKNVFMARINTLLACIFSFCFICILSFKVYIPYLNEKIKKIV